MRCRRWSGRSVVFACPKCVVRGDIGRLSSGGAYVRSRVAGVVELELRRRAAGLVRGVDGRDRDEGGAEVAHLGEQAVQVGLVGHCAAQGGGAVVLREDGQTAEPGRPVLVEMSGYPEFVVGGRVRAGS
jgi:hypothetical protein